MSRQAELSQWTEYGATAFPRLSQPQAVVLALWSFGIVLASSCGQTEVVIALLPYVGGAFDALRQRLREGLWGAKDKAGKRRRELEVLPCVGFRIRWIVRLRRSDSRRSPWLIALDPTTLRDEGTVLVVSVLCGGVAVPVAWKALPGNTPGEWNPHWADLMAALASALPRDIPVLALADRGLTGAWMYREIQRHGWHPLIRIKRSGQFRPDGADWRPLASFAPRPGSEWKGVGDAFKGDDRRAQATLVAYWEEGAKESWLLLTDLPPDAVDPAW